MATKTARAAEPAPEPASADPSMEDLFAPDRRGDLEALSSARLAELRREVSSRHARAKRRVEALERRDLSASSQADLAAHTSELAEAEAERRRAEHQGRALERAFRQARNREAEELAAHDAATTTADVLGDLCADCDQAQAAYRTAQAALQQRTDRLFEAAVWRRLMVNPLASADLRRHILAHCPTAHRLAELHAEGRSLMAAEASERWPALVIGSDGGARYEHLERIRDAADYREWIALSHPPLAIGSQASRQRGELAARFAARLGR